MQVGLSLTLVWSNTAYLDEADFLWIGRLELAHWLHGTSWPSASAYRFLSGSPTIYPPIGALANSIGGLAGARILSLCFMLGATILLCWTAWAPDWPDRSPHRRRPLGAQRTSDAVGLRDG